jgi:hypothetical protein
MKSRKFTRKELYQAVCDDVLVDVQFENLVMFVLDGYPDLQTALVSAMLVAQIKATAEKLRDQDIEQDFLESADE